MKFENLKITLFLENGVILNNKNPFDGVLASLYANKLKKEGKYKEYEHKLIYLPFVKMTNGIYHTSCPVIDQEKAFVENIVYLKAFDKKLYQTVGDNPNKNIDTQRGPFKSYVIKEELLHIKEIKFYVCGDIDTIENLLENLTFFGKKSSIGIGRVEKIEMEKIEKDFSLFDENGNPNRPLPIKDFDIKSDKKALKRPIYPYWERSGYEVCYVL